MVTKAKISIELNVDVAQEVHYSLESLLKKIDWVLENQPPRKPSQLEALQIRRELLERASLNFKDALNNRALENSTKPTLKAVK